MDHDIVERHANAMQAGGDETDSQESAEDGEKREIE